MELTPREARLRPECADHHPTLPVSRWTDAGALATLVASGGPGRHSARRLLETDFEFRGGGCHRWLAARARTRSGEIAQ